MMAAHGEAHDDARLRALVREVAHATVEMCVEALDEAPQSTSPDEDLVRARGHIVTTIERVMFRAPDSPLAKGA